MGRRKKNVESEETIEIPEAISEYLGYYCGDCTDEYTNVELYYEHICLASKNVCGNCGQVLPNESQQCDCHTNSASNTFENEESKKTTPVFAVETIKRELLEPEISIEDIPQDVNNSGVPSLYNEQYINPPLAESEGWPGLTGPTAWNKATEDIIVEAKKNKRYYRCTICNQKMTSKTGLDVHMVIEHGEVYFCEPCGLNLTEPSEIKQHKRSHQGPRPCPVCGKIYAGRARLRDHMTSHTGEKPFECHLCNGRFPYAASLVKHLRIHNEKDSFKCEICGKGFVFKSKYLQHIDVIHNGVDDTVKCHICNGTYKKRNIKAHLKKHGEATLTCDVCHGKFHLKEQLRRHRFKHHKDVVPCLKCQFCGMAYGTVMRLQKHLVDKHGHSDVT